VSYITHFAFILLLHEALIFHGFFLRPEMISAILKQFEKRLNQLHAFLERQGFL